MAAPVLQWVETNTASAVNTPVTSLVFASADLPSNTANLTLTNPIFAGSYSYEKWWRIQVVTPATTSLSGFSIYFGSQVTDISGQPMTVMFFASTTANVPAYPAIGPSNALSTIATLNTNSYGQNNPLPFLGPANTINAFSNYIVLQLQPPPMAVLGAAVFPPGWISYSYTWS